MTSKKNDFSRLDFNSELWNENPNSIWLASTLKLYRNLAKFHFPGKLDAERRKQVLSLAKNCFANAEQLSKPQIILADELAPIDKELLFEHFLATEGFHHAHTGEGFVIDDSKQFLTVLNVRNHLMIQLLDLNGELENTWSRLVSIETTVGQALPFAFSSKFGFLTADPHLTGTAFAVNTFLHLPALIYTNKLEALLELYAKQNIVGTGIQGEPGELVGDILILHNQQTIGVTENDIMGNIRSATTKLVAAEQSERNDLKDNPCPEVKDRVSRAFGLLSHSYKLETIECWEALSACKLAVSLGWIKGLDHTILNSLLFNCRRAHLTRMIGEDLSPEDIALRRAEYIRKHFEKATLLR